MRVGRLGVAELSETIDLDKIVAGLPNRIHRVADSYVAKFPDRVALLEDGASWTYRELDRSVKEVATVLGSLGVRAGDRMIIVSENCIALAALLLAASRIDAWAIVANPRLSPRELDQIRDHSGARRMFFTSKISREAAAHALRYGAESRQLGSLKQIGVGPLNEGAVAEPVERDLAKQVAVLIYTSGTTGTPKGVMLSHENLLISAKTTAHFRKMEASDKVYVVLPISHIVGISLLIMTLMVGATVRLVSKYDPAALAKAIAKEGITILNGVPATYQRLLEYKTAAGELHVRGRNVMRGYYRAPDLTAKVIDSEGWFNTGDLARFDGDCLHIVGRTKEMIIRSGFNVYPAEVEAVLNSHKDVVQSAVVGRAVDGNEEVVAFVQLIKGSPVKSADLMAFVNPQLTSYKRPSKIIVLDVLPATSTGKILKHKLAESLHGA
jgi:acyl-CoA synthetase (AMP-forming)/AMP-acid ligase II